MILARSSAGRQKAGLRRELASRRESSGCRARSRILPKPKDTCWPIDTHTRAKHQILREYLQVRIPVTLDTDSTASRSLIPGRRSPSERSDAGFVLS